MIIPLRPKCKKRDGLWYVEQGVRWSGGHEFVFATGPVDRLELAIILATRCYSGTVAQIAEKVPAVVN